MVNLLDIVNNIDPEEIAERWDSILVNPYSKMGTEKDWTTATRPGYIKKMPKEQLETLSVEPAINRICTAYADSAILKGWEFTFGRDGDAKLAKKINELGKDLELANAMNEAQFLANVYGGAAIIQFIDDGNSPDQPINYRKIRAVKGYRVLDRYKIRPDYRGFEDPKRVEHYEIMLPEYLSGELKKLDRNRFEKGYYVHRDRILRFDGTRCTPDLMRYNNGWAFSLIEQIYDKFQRYETSLSSSAAMLKDYSLFVFKMKGWADKVLKMEGKQKEEAQKQLSLLYLMATVYGVMIIDQEEHTLEFPKRDFGSIRDISDTHRDAFIGASGIPHTKLFGESPSGLGATGESEERTWAHEVGAFQVSSWLPKLNKAYKSILASVEQSKSPTVKKGWTIKFHSVLQLSEEEILSNRATQAQSDSTYVINQILTPEEVRESRFGGSEYSIETILDQKAWDKLQQQQQGFGGGADYFEENTLPGGETDLSENALNSPPEEQTLLEKELFQQLDSAVSTSGLGNPIRCDLANKTHRIIEYQGLKIGVETEVGQKRFPDVPPLTAAYGHIRGSYGLGLDGMSLDVYLGSNLDNPEIYQVLQLDKETGEPDEHKYFFGFKDINQARSFFLALAGKARFGGIKVYPGGAKAIVSLLKKKEVALRIDSEQKTLDTVERINLARSDHAQNLMEDWLEIIEGWIKSKNTLQEIRDGEIELYQLLPQKKFQTLIEQGNTIAELIGRTEDV